MDKRVIILTIETQGGGIPSMVNAMARLLARKGFSPVVVRAELQPASRSHLRRLVESLTRWTPPQIMDYGDLPTMLLPAPPFPLWLHYLVPQFLFGPLLREPAGVITVSGSAHVALPLALRGAPYVLWVATLYEDELRAKSALGDRWANKTLSGIGWRLLQMQERLALNRAARVLALSSYTAQRLQQFAPAAADRIETMLYPINTELFHPDPAVRQAPPHGRYLLLTARINDPRKNVGMLLRAFALVHKRHPDLNLVLVGEFPDDTLKKLAHDLGISDRVVYLGPLDARSPELIKLYQGAELFVLPSIQEGLGISVLEAIACGTPVISTPCGGPEGVVIEGRTGRMVQDVHDHEAFAEAVCDVLARPDELARMREQCVQFARTNFDAGAMAERLHQVLEQMNAARALPRRGREIMAALWAVAVLGLYVSRQLALRWGAVKEYIIGPLFGW